MKLLKTLAVILMSILGVSCSSDDDSSSDGNSSTPTTAQRLTAGIWYLESKTPGGFTDCEKNSSFNFKTDNTIEVESFVDNSGACESDGIINSTYSLSNNNLIIDFGGDSITATINDISSNTMTITDSDGDVIDFDKTQG